MTTSIIQEQVKISGTLHFNGHDYDLLAPNPFPIRNVNWKMDNTCLFYVVTPEGYGTYLYVHGDFVVDFVKAGEIREVKYVVDDEKGDNEKSNKIRTLVETAKV